MSAERCPECGNELHDWANGRCYTCTSIEQNNRRFGDAKRRRPAPTHSAPRSAAPPRAISYRRTAASLPATSLQQPPPSAVKQPSIEVARAQSLACMALLRDIYGHRLHLSNLLVRFGRTQAEVDRWVADVSWKCNFIHHFVFGLQQRLADALPTHDSRILVSWYGLDGSPPSDAHTIAARYQRSAQAVRASHTAMLTYLRQTQGEALLKALVTDVLWKLRCFGS